MTHLITYPGNFLHGINLSDPYPCWNLYIWCKLCSPEFLAATDPGIAAEHKSIRDVDIPQLRDGMPPVGAYSPRAISFLWAASLLRKGWHVGIGTIETKWLSRENRERILEIGDIELDLEEGRRQFNPQAASRLTSLYVADDNPEGHLQIQQMLGPAIYILRVRIAVALRVTRVDTNWFDHYCNGKNKELIEGYWSGVPFDALKPKWEYLVEGLIEAYDPEQLDYVNRNGSRFLNT